MKRWLTAISFMLFLPLAGCGFHLRGPVELAPPLKRLYLETQDPYGELARNIKQYLKLSGVTLTENPKDASVVLDIMSETTGQQLLSVGGTQQTRQYNLTLTIAYQLTAPNGKVIVPMQNITESQTLTVQASQILGGSNESNNLYHQMRRAIVYDLMNQLASNDTTTRAMHMNDVEKPR
jgi:LPS-assembly lipoprotein